MEWVDADGELMLRYRSGDVGAFETLYERHKGPLYRYLLRQVRDPAAASDLFQDVWSRVIAARHRYEARAKFATFLFHVAHHCTIDHHRRGRTAPFGADDGGGAAEPESPEHDRPDRIAERGEQRSALLAALARLPPEQREAFLLREEGGLGLEEIARITGVGVETAKSRLRYAVRKLKEALAEAPPRVAIDEPPAVRMRAASR